MIDGDSFAHRAYHALPKTIRRAGNKGAGAILGFANILLRLYEAESPRAVLVGWDTLNEPTYRHKALASYQSGRSFDAELIEQLEVLLTAPSRPWIDQRLCLRCRIKSPPGLRPLFSHALGSLSSWLSALDAF
jgi:5'-3' exonuclease